MDWLYQRSEQMGEAGELLLFKIKKPKLFYNCSGSNRDAYLLLISHLLS